MTRLFVFLTIFFVLCFYGRKIAGKHLDSSIDDPDTHRNVSELITSKGYPVEEHTVQTTDGYLLSLIRIPHGRNDSSKADEKDVVLLIHGILEDASKWVLDFPGQSLGFILPDEGYDVWMLNTRGCKYSKKHVKYKTSQYQFWNFSFDQVAQYDVPETIDYILKATEKEDLSIIGYSQGTTVTFAMLSEMPAYNDKVKLFIAIAPVATVGYMTSAFTLLIPFADQIAFAIEVISSGEFSPNHKIPKIMSRQVHGKDVPELSKSILGMGAPNSVHLNETRLNVYRAHYPSITSAKSLVHYTQMVKSKKFRKYDYESLNMKYYHQEEPPEYDVSRITTPVALIWAKNDTLAHPKDVAILRKKLKNLVFDYCPPDPFNHFNLALGENVPKLIYKPVLQLLSEY